MQASTSLFCGYPKGSQFCNTCNSCTACPNDGKISSMTLTEFVLLSYEEFQKRDSEYQFDMPYFIELQEELMNLIYKLED